MTNKKTKAPAKDIEQLECDLEDGDKTIVITPMFARYLLQVVYAYVTLRDDVRQALKDQQEIYKTYDWDDKFTP